MFKKICFFSVCCLMLSAQSSWACGPQPQPSQEGLFDVVADILTAPCRLLGECFSLSEKSASPGCRVQSPRQENCVYICVPICSPKQSTAEWQWKCRPHSPVPAQPKTSTVKKTVPKQSVQIETTPIAPAVPPAALTPKVAPKPEERPLQPETPTVRAEPPSPQVRTAVPEPAKEPSFEQERRILPEVQMQQRPVIPPPDSAPVPKKNPEEKPVLDTFVKPAPAEKSFGGPQPPPSDLKLTEPKEDKKVIPEPVPETTDQEQKKSNRPAVPEKQEKKTRSNPCAPTYPVPWCYPPPVCR